jgi:hypothetical protein
LHRLRDLPSVLSPGARRVAAVAVDVLIVLESLVVALLFRFDGAVPEEFWHRFWPFAAFAAVVFVAFLVESKV